MILLDVEEELEEFNEFNDNEFNIDDSVVEAKEILKNEMEKYSLSYCIFEENLWVVEDRIDNTRLILDFNDLLDSVMFNKDIVDHETFLKVCKCWVTTFFTDSSSAHLRQIFKGLKDFFCFTNGLNENEIEHIQWEWRDLGEKGKMAMCISALNFLDYCSVDDLKERFVRTLLKLKSDTTWEAIVRKLPPSSEVLMFSYITEDYFSKPLSEREYVLYFPIWLWWNITNIIPLRPSEFCKINRNCLSYNENTYYITLPRIKQKKSVRKRIQIVDKISIPKELYMKIEDYINRTNKYGESTTLISHPSMAVVENRRKKLKPKVYSASSLRSLLRKFYKDILMKKYNVVFNNSDKTEQIKGGQIRMTKRLNPGDTRHFAFLNLKRQGYHPVEIARLGGHTTLEAQYHYHQHEEYWVDTEILQLFKKFNLNENRQKKVGLSHVSNTQIDQEFKDKYVLRPPATTIKIPLLDGYCTHPQQPCKVEDCWDCNFWRISFEELQEKAHILEEKIAISRSRLNALITSLQKLYSLIYNDSTDLYTTHENPEIHKTLYSTAKSIDKAIEQYANLARMKEGIVYNVKNKR
jgi:hypothetical protein